MIDPVIQRYISHFYDVHGTLHITIRPDLTDALGWAKSKRESAEKDPYLAESLPVHLELDYDKKGNIVPDSIKIAIPKADEES